MTRFDQRSFRLPPELQYTPTRVVPSDSSLLGLNGEAKPGHVATENESQDAIRESHQEGQIKKAQRRRNQQANQS